MRKACRKELGITLVALIVTIIILIILAGISIASLTGNGLFEKAKLAKDKQENAQIEEDATLDKYVNEINTVVGSRDTVTLTQEQYNRLVNKQYGYFFKQEDNGKINNSIVNLEKVEGNMEFNSSNSSILLEKSRKYYISFSARTYDTSDYGDIIIYDETNSKILKRINWCGTSWNHNASTFIYTPTEDIYISMRVTTTGDIQYLNSSTISIHEI